MKTIAIVIPSLHRPDLTARCIESVQRQTLPAELWKIVVVENQAMPGSILADPLPRNTMRIELPANEGTTNSINRGMAAVPSPYVLLLNNDVELQANYLEKLLSTLEADESLGFATGKLLRAADHAVLDGAGDAMTLGGGCYRLGHLAADMEQYDRPMPLLSACGAAVLYRSKAFLLSGALDADFFAYLDDLDLALRVHLIGYRGAYVPDATAYHIGSATLGRAMHPKVVEYITRNQFFVLTKDYPVPVFRRLLVRILLHQLLWFGFAVKNSGLGPYLRGLRGATRGRKRMQQKHRDLMAKRVIDDERLFALMGMSERQVFQWQQALPPERRSSLLTTYFRFFPPQ
ncbi:MAG TPA: glycosyltransferase family 2 protein [Terriglobales bacterium]|nr:glycosyltransferase family 2 protein [Terriglobales bacterium]